MERVPLVIEALNAGIKTQFSCTKGTVYTNLFFFLLVPRFHFFFFSLVVGVPVTSLHEVHVGANGNGRIYSLVVYQRREQYPSGVCLIKICQRSFVLHTATITTTTTTTAAATTTTVTMIHFPLRRNIPHAVHDGV